MTWMLVIEPGHNRMGIDRWDPGIQCGMLTEADLTWETSLACRDELERAGVRHMFLREAREGQGLAGFQRAELCPHNGTHVAFHFEDGQRGGLQAARIYHGRGPESRRLAEQLAVVLQTWGDQTTNRYPTVRIGEAAYPGMDREDTASIVISAFSLTGIDAIVYSRRLRQLGQMVGSHLAMWAVGRNPGVRCYQPLTAQRDVKHGQPAKPLSELWRGRKEEPRTASTSGRISTRSQDEPSEEYQPPEA
jgi:hypothetical protein